MKITAVVLLIAFILSGCAGNDGLMNQAMDLRQAILDADQCTFLAVVTADYEDEIYTFQMECTADSFGTLQFRITDPPTINGITGKISSDGGALTFDDAVLAFPMLADGQLTPVSAPWFFLNALCGGYLTGCSKEEKGICIYIDDTFEENALHLEVLTDESTMPVYAEYIWQDRRVLSMDIRNFTLQ